MSGETRTWTINYPKGYSVTCMQSVVPEFKVREYRDADDRGFIDQQWGDSYRQSRRGLVVGATDDEQITIDWHVTHSDIDILCDHDNEGLLYGFCCHTGDAIHYVSLKRSVVKENLAADALRVLLGERLHRPCGFTAELVELVKLRAVPSQWYLDGTWYVREGRFVGGNAA